MRIVLEIVEGFAAGRKKALRAPVVLTVGRGESADWMVAEDTAMSSNHFQVSVNQQGCVVTDLDSTNGTIVDGQRIAARELRDGDRIKAGATVFQISISQRPRSASLIAGLNAASNAAPESASAGTNAIATESSRPPSVKAGGESQQATRERPEGYQVPKTRSRPFTGAVIEVCSENAHGRKSILRSGQSITVGRTEQADFVIQDPMLSARHFTVSSTASGWQLVDLDSSSGTQVGGANVSKTLLRTGDRILAGQTEFVVTIGESVPTGGKGGDSSIPFREGVQDEDPDVRRAAMEAAAWSGEPWLLDFCRESLQEPSPENEDALRMFSILALPSDLDAILRLGRSNDLGPMRFDLLASFGHPAVIPTLLDALRSEDPETAVAAGAAFTRITGLDVQSTNRAKIPPGESEQDDEFAEEFAEEVLLPDPVKADEFWKENEGRFASGTCFRQGIESSGTPSSDLLAQLDMRSRFEVCLRSRFEGKWKGRPFDLERFLIP